MNKYIIAAVAFVLMITSFLLPSGEVISTVSAGEGSETNAEVSSVNEIPSILDFIINRQNSVMNSTRSASSEEDGLSVIKQKHTAATIHEDTVIDSYAVQKVAVDFDYSTRQYTYKDVGSITLKMNRSLSVYLTDEASFYESKGSFKYEYKDYEDTENSIKNYMIFDMKMYIDTEKVIFRFDTLDVSGVDSSDSNKLVGRWIQLPSVAASEISGIIDQANRDTLSELKKYIVEGIEGGFEKDNDIYTYKLEYYNKDDGLLTVDLTDTQSPYIEIAIDTNKEQNRFYMQDTLIATNIDNTYIKVNTLNVLVFETEEEFEEYMED